MVEASAGSRVYKRRDTTVKITMETLVGARVIAWCLTRTICVSLDGGRIVRGVEAGVQSTIKGVTIGEAMTIRDENDVTITTATGIETETETGIAMDTEIEDGTGDHFSVATDSQDRKCSTGGFREMP
jgi:hypothetical protein